MRWVPVFILMLAAAPAAADTAGDLVTAARAQISVTVTYDPSYQRIAYPMGDVPMDRGVCSDVVIRAFRTIGIDLQAELHRDMKKHFASTIWGLARPDANIDHRRVPNLVAWFTRQGKAQTVTDNANHYRAGDVVAWVLDSGRPHIGIASDRRSDDGQRPLMIHNIGWGTVEEDVIFRYRITGHFRPFPGP